MKRVEALAIKKAVSMKLITLLFAGLMTTSAHASHHRASSRASRHVSSKTPAHSQKAMEDAAWSDAPAKPDSENGGVSDAPLAPTVTLHAPPTPPAAAPPERGVRSVAAPDRSPSKTASKTKSGASKRDRAKSAADKKRQANERKVERAAQKRQAAERKQEQAFMKRERNARSREARVWMTYIRQKIARERAVAQRRNARR
jgi:hypothetical protein